jgi:hypothetical protein
MPLSAELLPVDLTFECPYCNNALVKRGSWFQTAHCFACASCRREIHLSYADKVALFERHAHMAAPVARGP